MAELKDSILAEAADNARIRATQIAKHSGGDIGSLDFAHMGAMIVTGAYEDESTGSQGPEDTKSLDKKVTVEVTSGYTIR